MIAHVEATHVRNTVCCLSPGMKHMGMCLSPGDFVQNDAGKLQTHSYCDADENSSHGRRSSWELTLRRAFCRLVDLLVNSRVRGAGFNWVGLSGQSVRGQQVGHLDRIRHLSDNCHCFV